MTNIKEIQNQIDELTSLKSSVKLQMVSQMLNQRIDNLKEIIKELNKKDQAKLVKRSKT